LDGDEHRSEHTKTRALGRLTRPERPCKHDSEQDAEKKHKGNQREGKREGKRKGKYTLKALDCASIPDDEKTTPADPMQWPNPKKQNSHSFHPIPIPGYNPCSFSKRQIQVPMSLKVKLHGVALKHHSSLALQEWTRHLSHFAGLNKTVPLGGTLRCLAELDKSAALEGVALCELHHIASATPSNGRRREECGWQGCQGLWALGGMV
jgi:hypothetical protein